MKFNNVPSSQTNFPLAMYFFFKLVPSGGAIFTIYLGYRLFILGVTGQASLSIQSQSISGQLLNAAPGLFFAIGGIIVLIIVVWNGVNIEFHDPYITPRIRRLPPDFKVSLDEPIESHPQGQSIKSL